MRVARIARTARCFWLAACVTLVACTPAVDQRPDVIIVIAIDTLRADHLGAYGYARPTSPAIDRWSQSGRLFELALAPSPWTLPSMASLLTGEMPARHSAGEILDPEGARNVLKLDAGVRTLAEALQENGFKTGAIVNNVFLGPQFGLQRGFDDYDYVYRSDLTERRADEVTDRALRWIDVGGPGKLFLFVHYMDPHMNYDAPAGFRGRFTNEFQERSPLRHPVDQLWEIRSGALPLSDTDRQFVAAAYDEEIAFVDTQIERLRAGLEKRGLLDQALIVLTSDHGEEFFEHGGFEHGHALWQEIVRIPLIVWGPTVTPGREERPVSLIDIAPTVLELAGVPALDGIEGISLVPNLRDGAPIPERMITFELPLWGPDRIAALRWPYKFESMPESERHRLFDLAADPDEIENVGNRHPVVRRKMSAELTTRLEQARAQRGPAKRAEVDGDTETMLRSLGYIE